MVDEPWPHAMNNFSSPNEVQQRIDNCDYFIDSLFVPPEDRVRFIATRKYLKAQLLLIR
jgi:hypothetical protein